MNIKLEHENLSTFAWEGLDLGEEEYEFVETIEDLDNLYKDYCPATTICKRLSDNTYWALDWSYYKSHYGSGEHEYYNDEIYQVKQVEKVITTKEWISI